MTPDLQSGTQLRESVPRMAGFAFSLTVIGLFWVGHHGLFRRLKAIDRSLAVSIAAAGRAEAVIWLYAIHIRELALPGVPPVVYRWILRGSSRARWYSCSRSRSPSPSPSSPSTCGSSPSSASL